MIMKYSSILFLLIIVSCSTPKKDHFILRGIVPGAQDSTLVQLVIKNDSLPMRSTYILNERFEFQGKINQPTYCELFINNSLLWEKSGRKNNEELKYFDIDFFIENGTLDFRTPHIDSLPRAFWQHDVRKEKNYVLTGSAAQDAYYEYQQNTLLLRYDIRTLERKYYEENRIKDYKALLEKKEILRHKIFEFIQSHQNLNVNLHLAEELKMNAFTYDLNKLNKLEQLFSSYQDTIAPLQEFRQYIKRAASFVKEGKMREHEILTPSGEKKPLSSQLNQQGYTLIDFWASWCGPCRRSFPHLREMYKQYGDRITFISISIDKQEPEWKEAMNEEKLPWLQFLALETMRNDIKKYYDITSIPTFLLINPESKIVFSGHSSGELELQLEKL